MARQETTTMTKTTEKNTYPRFAAVRLPIGWHEGESPTVTVLGVAEERERLVSMFGGRIGRDGLVILGIVYHGGAGKRRPPRAGEACGTWDDGGSLYVMGPVHR